MGATMHVRDVDPGTKARPDAAGKFEFAALDLEIARQAALLEWPHRDPFDRIIAATALEAGAPLVSKDASFDGCAGLSRVWGGQGVFKRSRHQFASGTCAIRRTRSGPLPVIRRASCAAGLTLLRRGCGR